MAVALGQLQPPKHLLQDTLTAAVSARMQQYSSVQLADVLWGLGKAGRAVARDWHAAVWQQLMAHSTQVRSC